MTRARKNQIVVNLNSLGGKPVDAESRADGKTLVYDAQTDSYLHEDPGDAITFEALSGNGDIGTGADQVARGDHDHDVGDLVVLFENQLI